MKKLISFLSQHETLTFEQIKRRVGGLTAEQKGIIKSCEYVEKVNRMTFYVIDTKTAVKLLNDAQKTKSSKPKSDKKSTKKHSSNNAKTSKNSDKGGNKLGISTDHKAKEAIALINKMMDRGMIMDFIEKEHRTTVILAGTKRVEKLK